MTDNKEIAKNILSAVGGSQNIKNATHCMTRLRLTLNDDSFINDESVKEIEGVLGVVRNDQQYQIIIGTNVQKVYSELSQIAQFTTQPSISENDHTIKDKLTVKKIGNNIINYMSKCMTPLIPVLLAAGLCKALNSILGPSLLNVYSDTSNLSLLLNFVFEAGFYFMPIYVGINAAKQLKMESMLGGYMGAILIAPGLIALVNEGKTFDILGLPVMLNNYSQTVIPVMLSVYFMSLIYRILKKYTPDVLTTLVTPFLSVLIATPVALCLLAPLGSIIGNLISDALLWFGDKTGFIGTGIFAGIWQLLVLTGMHLALMMPMLSNFFETGQMSGVAIAAGFSVWACFGVALGAALRLRNKKEKGAAVGAFISGIVGGVTEPILYGICFAYKRCFLAMMLGGFIGGAYSQITNVHIYVMTNANFLSLLGFTGGTTANMINGIIASILSLVVATVVTYMFGFSKNDLSKT